MSLPKGKHRKGVLNMTSKEHIESLRRHGVRLIAKDGMNSLGLEKFFRAFEVRGAKLRRGQK